MSYGYVAQTIAEQLGSGTIFMLGSKKGDLIASNTRIDGVGVNGEPYHRETLGTLTLRIKCQGKITHLQISLTNSDDYILTFLRIRGVKFKVVKECRGVYVDSMHEVIRDVTGLETSMPKVRMV